MDRYGSALKILGVAGERGTAGIGRLGDECGAEPKELLPLLLTLSFESRPQLLGDRRRFLGAFDTLVLVGILALVGLILRAVLLTL